MNRISRFSSRLTGWAWASLLGKAFAWALLFMGLAHVGSASLVAFAEPARSPPPRLAEVASTGGAPQPTGESRAPPPCASAVASALAASGSVSATLADGRIVLNLANATDLMKLPGIGQKRADAIVALRERQGRFRSLRDLLRVRGLGNKTLTRLAPLVVNDPPTPTADPPSTERRRQP
ncbi:MAG: helix-hairpin-helix domain-containing protein [Myxococcales bacterium]|nr:helix-hairpin-helix domain-containing protein [Myxococcales bacterium]